jgi:hypothetical protein
MVVRWTSSCSRGFLEILAAFGFDARLLRVDPLKVLAKTKVDASLRLVVAVTSAGDYEPAVAAELYKVWTSTYHSP